MAGTYRCLLNKINFIQVLVKECLLKEYIVYIDNFVINMWAIFKSIPN